MEFISGIQLSFHTISLTELTLITFVGIFAAISYFSMRRVSHLEDRIESQQLALHREIKMVNHGAIGIGRRFSLIEKNMKKPNNVARFELPKELTNSGSLTKKPQKVTSGERVQTNQITAQQHSVSDDVLRNESTNVSSRVPNNVAKEKPKGLTTKAEKTLSAWIKAQQSA